MRRGSRTRKAKRKERREMEEGGTDGRVKEAATTRGGKGREEVNGQV